MRSKMKDLFPYEGFPIRLEHKEGKTKKVCHFQCVDHFEKYVTRHKLKPSECKALHRDGIDISKKKKKAPKRKPKGKLFSSIDEFFA